MKFRKKPVIIEAIKHRGEETWPEVSDFLQSSNMPYVMRPDETLRIITREGIMTAEVGDWIIRGIKEELYPCKPDIFEQTYEPIEDEK